jgi:hypothetical protein
LSPFLGIKVECVGQEYEHRGKTEEKPGEWRKLHNEELTDLYFSPNIIQNDKSSRMKWAGHVARMGSRKAAYRVLVVKPEGKRSLGRQWQIW